MNIGQKLKEERQKKQLTQQELAEILNVSRTTVSSWEVGRTYPDLDILVALGDLYGASLDNLLREDKKMVDIIAKTGKTNRRLKRILAGIAIVVLMLVIVNAAWFIKANIEFRFTENWNEHVDESFYQ